MSNSNGVRRCLLPCNLFNSQPGSGILVRLSGSGTVFGRYRLTFEPARATLVGATSVCLGAAAPFTVNNLLPGATVSWRTTTSGVLTLPPTATGPTITATASGSGNTTLVATIDDNGCTYELSRSVSVNAASLGAGSSESYVCEFATIRFRATPFNVAPASLRWYVKLSSSSTFAYQSSYDGQTDIAVNARKFGTVEAYVRGTDQCGGQSLQSSTVSVTVDRCGSFAQMYPNPADDHVEVSTAATESRSISISGPGPGAANPSPLRVELYNGQGRRLRVVETPTNTLRLDTSHFPPGLYQGFSLQTGGFTPGLVEQAAVRHYGSRCKRAVLHAKPFIKKGGPQTPAKRAIPSN